MICNKILTKSSINTEDFGAPIYKGIDNTVQCDCDMCHGNDINFTDVMMLALGDQKTKYMQTKHREIERRKTMVNNTALTIV